MSTRTASVPELAELLQTWHRLLANARRSIIPALVWQYADQIEDLVDTISEPGSGETLEHHRREVGLCPDSGDHWLADCPDRECPNWVQHMRESAQ